MNCQCKVCHSSSFQTDNQYSTDLNKNATKTPNVNDYWSASVQKLPFNIDLVPKIIRKKSKCDECNHDVTVKYLEPSKTMTPPSPIIINQAGNKLTPPSPSFTIRQQPCRQTTCYTNHRQLSDYQSKSQVPYETGTIYSFKKHFK